MNFICPLCKSQLTVSGDFTLPHTKCDLIFHKDRGIWRFLLPERQSYYAQFISDYESIRSHEMRGSTDSAYYRALPFKDLTGRFASDWKIRAASYRALTRILNRRGAVLDLGAGNAWLSNQLSGLGYEAYAVDLLTNPQDGLGAHVHYQNPVTHIQAEFVKLPFPDDSISCAIFNASFHYAENYEETLTEVLRVLLPDGVLIIMDSPVYRSPDSGIKMVEERKLQFTARYGIASNALKSENYLTYKRMDQLEKKYNIQWKHIRPYYGLRWIARPLIASLRGWREPAEFGLWVGRV